MSRILIIVAFVLFILAAVNWQIGFNFVALGLALYMASKLVPPNV
jgi:hypothetical protein